MASSSRPFQSKTIGSLVAQYHQWAYKLSRSLRQGRVALLWGLQVALYPAYALFQSSRVLYRRLQANQPLKTLMQRVVGAEEAPALTSDTPLRALLSALGRAPASNRNRALTVNRAWTFLGQSRAGALLAQVNWSRVRPDRPLQGVACQLNSRDLVLVTVDNQIVANLSPDQQARLQQAIVLLLAEYAAQIRRQHRRGQLGQQPLPPLPQSRVLWRPVQWLWAVMGWMQVSGVAIATNVFGELQIRRRSLNHRPTPRLAAKGEAPNPAGTAIGTAHPGWPAGPGDEAGPNWFTRRPPRMLLGPSSASPTQALLQRSPGSASSSIDALDPAPYIDIEAKATLVGYVDHPLAMVLRWLDQLLLWLETGLYRLVLWLRNHL